MIEDPLHPTDTELSLEVETGTGALRLDLTRRLAAEALGTAFLIVAVIGSGFLFNDPAPTARPPTSACSSSRTQPRPPGR